MKKLISILIALGVMALSYQLIFNFFISKKEMNYSIKNEDASYLVTEKFYKQNGKHIYDYYVSDEKNNQFFFSNVGDYNKQMKLLKNIVRYKDKNISCYLPIMKDDSVKEMNCIYNKELIDYNYLSSIDADTDSILKYYDNMGYSRDSWKISSNKTKKYAVNNNSTIYVYKDNIPSDYILPIWNYSGISFVSKKGVVVKQYLDNDIYNNNYSYLMGKYYFIFNLQRDVDSTSDLYIINMEDYGKTSLLLPESVSGKMYFNGAFQNKLYFTDLKSKKQYTVDPIREKIEVVGNEDNGYNVLDGNKLGKLSTNEFLGDKYYFNSPIVEEIGKRFPKAEIKSDGNNYAFKTVDGSIYLVSSNNLKLFKRMFHFGHISEWDIKNGDIMVLSEDTMYLYTEDNGLRPVIRNKEFTFNHFNICNIYKKS